MKKSLLLAFLSFATCAIQAEDSLDIEPEQLSLRESSGVFSSDHGGSGVFGERSMGMRGNPAYETTRYSQDRYEGDYNRGRSYNRQRNWDRIDQRRLQDRNYNNYDNYNNYYNDGSYVPVNRAESYNNITNPYPGTGSQTRDFQNSTFDNQVWDFNN